jgi:hypothetical protein
LSGEIEINDSKIEVYHLDNNKRVISGRGIQKILGIKTTRSSEGKRLEPSGNALKNLLISFKKYENCPDKVYEIEKVFNDEVIRFKRKGAGGSRPDTNGFEATFLMDICHFIQDLYLSGLLPEKYFVINNLLLGHSVNLYEIPNKRNTRSNNNRQSRSRIPYKKVLSCCQGFPC